MKIFVDLFLRRMYNELNMHTGGERMTLGKKIELYMNENGLTYETFGKKCGLSKGYISMLVNNRNPKTGKPPIPTVETYNRLAKSMGMTLDILFNEIDNSPIRVGTSDMDEADIIVKQQSPEKEQPQSISVMSSPSQSTRKWKMLSAGVLTLTDEQLDKLYDMAHVLYPDNFPERND